MLESKAYFAATTADRRLHLFDTDTSALTLAHSYTSFVDSPILDLHVIQGKYLLAAFMSGKLLLYNTQTEEVLDERRDQKKYIVRLATWSVDGSSTIIASAGWDSKVYLYRLVIEGNHKPRLGEPIATLALLSIPETLLFVRSPDTLLPILLLSRRDSTFLYFYSVPSSGSGETGIELLGRQNLAPHSNAWVAFTPSDIQLSPHDDSLIAVATSSTPHMKLLIVRLLIPPKTSLNVGMESGPDPTAVTQASQTRANLLLQDKEEAAILININTMAPQTTYSTPCLAWRPDGSGVYVSSDDGIVRGFETTTGKYIATLEAHEPGSKLRCLWAGRVKTQTNETPCEEEFLLTGGFDQKLVLWRSS
jgi:WD40 repeat protein